MRQTVAELADAEKLYASKHPEAWAGMLGKAESKVPNTIPDIHVLLIK